MKNLENKLPKQCIHLEYCIVRKTFRDKNEYKNYSLEKSKDCQTAKFYLRYPNHEEMFIQNEQQTTFKKNRIY